MKKLIVSTLILSNMATIVYTNRTYNQTMENLGTIEQAIDFANNEYPEPPEIIREIPATMRIEANAKSHPKLYVQRLLHIFKRQSADINAIEEESARIAEKAIEMNKED